MNYYVLRNEQKFGPYSLAELQRYVGTGNILTTDLAQSEGMQEWIPVSQVIGNIGVAPSQPPLQPPQQNFGQTPAYGAGGYAPGGYAQGGYAPAAFQPPGPPAGVSQYPDPPDLHWAVVWLIGACTCGLFMMVWHFIVANYVKKIDPNSKGMLFYTLYIVGAVVGYIVMIAGAVAAGNGHDLETVGGICMGLGWLMIMGGVVVFIVGNFNIRKSLEEHFNTAEQINLRLSGAMTFFFHILYFQYHFNRINNWRRTGILM